MTPDQTSPRYREILLEHDIVAATLVYAATKTKPKKKKRNQTGPRSSFCCQGHRTGREGGGPEETFGRQLGLGTGGAQNNANNFLGHSVDLWDHSYNK